MRPQPNEGNRNCHVQLRRQRQDCRTCDGQVQLPGKILLQADDAVGKHCSLTGVSERVRADETERVRSVFVWVEGAIMGGETVHSYITCGFNLLLMFFLSGTKLLTQFAPTHKCTLLNKVIVIQSTVQHCSSPTVREVQQRCTNTHMSNSLMYYAYLPFFSSREPPFHSSA